MFAWIMRKILKRKRFIKWRKKNPHNETFPINEFNHDVVQVGNHTYGGLQVLNHNINEKLIIGDFCSIAPDVVFILNADHGTRFISTFPFRVKCTGMSCHEGLSKGDITVGDDVWIGYGATILSGIHIGRGAVIAAGAVVTKRCPSLCNRRWSSGKYH